MDEIFDVVDEHDQVIRQETRREVHRRGLRHRAVHILIFNQRGQVFLQKRSMQNDSFPGAWDSSASGHLDTGEDYDACAVRELREEIGLELPERRVGTPGLQGESERRVGTPGLQGEPERRVRAPGLQGETLRKLFKIDACPETQQEFVWVYQGHAEGPFRLDPVEIERGQWFTPAEVTQRIQTAPENFASAFRLLWKRIES
jgi:isopentenyldiphosphate isomerase